MKLFIPIRTIILIALLSGTGCGLNPVTAALLGRQNPFTSDPEQIRIAVRMPNNLSVNTANYGVDYKTVGKQHKHNWQMEVVSLRGTNKAQVVGLGKFRKPGYHFEVARVKPSDLPELYRLQKTVPPPPRTRGSFQVGASPCYHGAMMPARMPVELYIKTDKIGQFSVLSYERDLLKDMKKHYTAKQLREEVPPCK